MPEVCTVCSNQGHTRIVAYEKGYPRVKIEFFIEQGVRNPPSFLQYLCKVVYNDNELQLAEITIDGLLRRLGHVLLALTEDVE